MDLIKILYLIMILLIGVIIVLALMYVSINAKQNSAKKQKAKGKNAEEIKAKTKSYKECTLESIFDFMEFAKVQDNMIVQKEDKRYLMVIECQGINYDLMSEIEKNSVEVGFMKVLNTLREPIQIHIQTRTINLEGSLFNYKERLSNIESELIGKRNKYDKMVESGKYSEEELRAYSLEIIRQENLYKYGQDIIANTERMSLNKNILRKKYYIVMSYYVANVDNEDLDKSEIVDTAFSDLYTRCQSLIRVLSSTGVIGKVLNSKELVDLLYNAYNRDETEIYGINKAEEADFDEMYVTAPDVLDKRMMALSKKVEEEALKIAEEALTYANEKEKEVEEAEKSLDEMIEDFAMDLIEGNREHFGDAIVETAKKEVSKKMKEGKANGEKTKTSRKSRK